MNLESSSEMWNSLRSHENDHFTIWKIRVSSTTAFGLSSAAASESITINLSVNEEFTAFLPTVGTLVVVVAGFVIGKPVLVCIAGRAVLVIGGLFTGRTVVDELIARRSISAFRSARKALMVEWTWVSSTGTGDLIWEANDLQLNRDLLITLAGNFELNLQFNWEKEIRF